MAIFPQGLSNIDSRCANTGERHVLHQLKRCLSDDFMIWHDVPLGPRARQPDFVILSPRQGILILEVKHWKRSTLVHANPDSVELRTERGLVTDANPVRKARNFAMELVDLMAKDPMLIHREGPFRGRLLFPYGWGAVFSGMAQKDVDATEFQGPFPSHQVLMKDDLDTAVDEATFQSRLWGMFTVSYPHIRLDSAQHQTADTAQRQRAGVSSGRGRRPGRHAVQERVHGGRGPAALRGHDARHA